MAARRALRAAALWPRPVSRWPIASWHGGLRSWPLAKPQDKLPGVAVGGDGVAAGLPLGGEAVGEERLQGGGQGAHECPPRCASRRWPASAISSGAADRYQNVCLGSVWPR